LQSEIKSSKIFTKGLIAPIRLRFDIKKIDEITWEIQHSEWFSLDNEELMRSALTLTSQAATALGFQIKRRKNRLTIKHRGSLNSCIDGLTTEMLSLSTIGDVSLRDLIILAGIGMKTAPTILGTPTILGIKKRKI